MFKNHIKIAFRSLIKNKGFTFINITGLAVGLAVCITIMLYVTHEMSYDQFHKNKERIFTMHAKIKVGTGFINFANGSYATGPLVKQNQPLVQDYMRTLEYFKPVIVSNPSTPQAKFSEKNLLFADPGFFNFFSFKLLAGQAGDVLNAPFTVVISKDMAKKYFGNDNPVGKTLNIKTDSVHTYHITGVADNSPSNSSISFNFVASNQSLMAMKEAADYVGSQQQIGFGSFGLYLQLKHATDTAGLSRNMNLMVKKEKIFDDAQFSFTPITDTHLNNNWGDSSNTKYLKIFPLVAILILLLALVNYMSLSTARATLRAKEVGVRKVAGASRKSIAMQFYVESAIFTGISFVFGYVLCYLFKPWFLNVLQLKIDNSFLYSPLVIMLLFALLVVTIIIAGSYPSLVLSAFKPVVTLKGKASKQAGGTIVRKIFTTMQFAISVGLIICGIIIDRQLYFFRHADTGINRDNVMMIPVSNSLAKNYHALKKDITDLAGVSGVATSHHAMFDGFDMFTVDGKIKGENVGIVQFAVDDQFVSLLGLKWKYPPAPSTQMASLKKIVINEVAINKLGLPANPIGSFISEGNNKIEVVGVIKNFNFNSMADELRPVGIFTVSDTTPLWNRMGCNLYVKIKPHTNLPSLLKAMQGIYKKYDQDMPFDYTFMDDAFNRQYKAEDRLASIFSIFTYLTIILATMGLFGLAAFTIEQRTKEIGVRKILGASLSAITTLLSKDFLKLVLLSVIISSPVDWWAMHNWLQNFAYRITIPWWVFTAAAVIALGTAIITISYHAVKAALANPVDSLRNE
jgi:putative ABC transport system permease protein